LHIWQNRITVPGMKSISIKLSPPLARWLSSRARELKRTQSDLVRDALEQQQRRQNGPSCHDLMKHLCGSLKNAPRDLSTNPKYMEGFGK
jgi:hypothetical protein